MRKLLNTLYVTSPDRYLSLDGENIVISEKSSEIARFPLHTLESIITCGYTGASPALMAACSARDIDLCFLTRYGKFLARVTGAQRGNVVLRKTQYHISEDPEAACAIAANFITGKIYNQKWVLVRAVRDHSMRIDEAEVNKVISLLDGYVTSASQCRDQSLLRGIEGDAAKAYFSVFNELILQQKDDFVFSGRNRRPPEDNVNALLSFVYTLLTSMCTSALESVGLDPFVGFLHGDRPGRASLSLDLMEELRAPVADRFVLTLINKRLVCRDDFEKKEDGAVLMSDTARKKILTSWQDKKNEEIVHPYLESKLEWGLVPYAQALLLARHLRGDIDGYPPFLWKA